MSEFINTRNGENDYEVLDGLVSDTIGEFNEDGINIIPRYKFSKTINLKKIHMPAVTIIKERAFNDSKIEECTFETLEKIEQYGFYQCTQLKSFYAPNLTDIGIYAFRGAGIESIDLTNVTNASSYCFSYSKLKSVIAPKVISNYCFSSCKDLVSIDLSLTTFIGTLAFESCEKLTTVNIYQLPSISSNAFYNSSLTDLIIHEPSSVLPLNSSEYLNRTRIYAGLGCIYVPDDMVEAYKAATNWSYYADKICSINEYPKTEFGTITDTWEEIFAAEEDGTYETKYSIGDTKSIRIDNKNVMMQIIAFNTDILADESDVAKITWLCKDTYENFSFYNSSQSVAWVNTQLRSHLVNDIYDKINDNIVKNKIVQVKKTYKRTSQLDGVSSDLLWIPSNYEIGLANSELDGIRFSEFFTDDSSRKKTTIYNADAHWWTRSLYNFNSSTPPYCTVNTSGRSSWGNGTDTYGVIFGFCT